MKAITMHRDLNIRRTKILQRCRNGLWAVLVISSCTASAQSYDPAPDNMRNVLFGDRLQRGAVIAQAGMNTTSGQGLSVNLRPGAALSKRISLHAVYEHIKQSEQEDRNSLGIGVRFWAPLTAGFLQTSVGVEVSRVVGDITYLGISVPGAVNVWMSPRIGLKIEFFRFNILNSLTEGTAGSAAELDLRLINPRLGLVFIAGGHRPN